MCSLSGAAANQNMGLTSSSDCNTSKTVTLFTDVIFLKEIGLLLMEPKQVTANGSTAVLWCLSRGDNNSILGMTPSPIRHILNDCSWLSNNLSLISKTALYS